MPRSLTQIRFFSEGERDPLRTQAAKTAGFEGWCSLTAPFPPCLTFRTVIGSQYVQKKLSIRASFLTGEKFFEATSGRR